MVKKIFVYFILLFALADISSAQIISVEASADSSIYQVGDYIHYTIQVTADKNLTITAPAVSDTLAGMELISQQNPQKEEKDNQQLITYSYTFSKYDSSDVTVPPVQVFYETKGDTAAKSINTNPVFFKVRPVKINTAEDIKDVKEPLKIPLDWKWIIFWVLVALIVISVAYYFYRRYQKRKAEMVPEKIIIKIPPHVTALNSLRTLKEKQLWQKGMIKEYHSEITEIIRRYFEERFNLPALEMTSGESIDALQKRRGTEKIIDDTHNFLTNADLVKFAKYQPLASINEEMMRQAEEIVHKTKSGQEETVSEVAENV
jgi:uncharacterized repeat protein (TIGR01451 family)